MAALLAVLFPRVVSVVSMTVLHALVAHAKLAIPVPKDPMPPRNLLAGRVFGTALAEFPSRFVLKLVERLMAPLLATHSPRALRFRVVSLPMSGMARLKVTMSAVLGPAVPTVAITDEKPALAGLNALPLLQMMPMFVLLMAPMIMLCRDALHLLPKIVTVRPPMLLRVTTRFRIVFRIALGGTAWKKQLSRLEKVADAVFEETTGIPVDAIRPQAPPIMESDGGLIMMDGPPVSIDRVEDAPRLVRLVLDALVDATLTLPLSMLLVVPTLPRVSPTAVTPVGLRHVTELASGNRLVVTNALDPVSLDELDVVELVALDEL